MTDSFDPSDYEDFEDNGYFSTCRHCGAEYLDDPDEADHATDCPSNPYGFNRPEGVKLWMKADLETEESDRPIDLPIPVYTGSEF